MGAQLFRKKNIDQLISDSELPEHRLKKSLGWLSLTSLGIGAVIGSGIFTIIGTAIAGQKLQFKSVLNAPLLEYLIYHSASFGRPGAGPAIAFSFVLVGVVCAFAALCYAELAAMIPIAGSAYTYTYATMGELIAWIIGWDLILEYAVSNMAVSVGFSAHVVNLLDWFGVHPSLRWITPAYLPAGLADLQGNTLYDPGWHFGFNWPAFIIVMLLTVILVRGIRESANANNIMVLLKISGDHGVRDFRFASRASGQLASFRAQWLARHSDGRLDYFFHVHRIRFGFYGRGRVQRSQARFTDRNYRDAGDLHDSVYRGSGGADGPGALADAAG